MIKPKLEIRKWTEGGEGNFTMGEGTKEEIVDFLSKKEEEFRGKLSPPTLSCLLKCTFEEGWNDNGSYPSWLIIGHFQEPESMAQARLDEQMVKYNEYLAEEPERNKQKALNLQVRKEDRLKELNKEIVKMQEEILSKQELIKTLQTAWGLGDD